MLADAANIGDAVLKPGRAIYGLAHQSTPGRLPRIAPT